MATAQIIPFPSRIAQLNRADELVREWGRIQKIKDKEAKVIELFFWREQMKKHLAAPPH